MHLAGGVNGVDAEPAALGRAHLAEALALYEEALRLQRMCRSAATRSFYVVLLRCFFCFLAAKLNRKLKNVKTFHKGELRKTSHKTRTSFLSKTASRLIHVDIVEYISYLTKFC